MGSIVSVSAKDHTITVKAEGGDKVLGVAPKATFTRDGKTIRFEDVQAGQKIDATISKAKGKDLVEHASIST